MMHYYQIFDKAGALKLHGADSSKNGKGVKSDGKMPSRLEVI